MELEQEEDETDDGTALVKITPSLPPFDQFITGGIIKRGKRK